MKKKIVVVNDKMQQNLMKFFSLFRNLFRKQTVDIIENNIVVSIDEIKLDKINTSDSRKM